MKICSGDLGRFIVAKMKGNERKQAGDLYRTTSENIKQLDSIVSNRLFNDRGVIIVPALDYRHPPPEIARVKISTRTNLPGGLGGS